MDGQELPGFTYDPVKKKYFAIQPNHVASAGSQYSRAHVSKRKAEDQISKIEAAKQNIAGKQLVRRSKILSSLHAGRIGIVRETATDSPAVIYRESTARAYLAGFEQTWRGPSRRNLGPFCYDKASGSLLIANNADSGCGILEAFGPVRLRSMENFNQIAHLAHNHITSISISPSRVAMITSQGEPQRASVIIAPLIEANPREAVDAGLLVHYNLVGEVDIWACAANPFLHDQNTFAVAITRKAVLFTDVSGQWEKSQELPINGTPTAVEWLGPNLLSIGLRSGAVNLWDTRAQGTAQRLHHTGSITGIRRVSPDTMVICGVPNALALYDLRMSVVKSMQVRKDRHNNAWVNQPVFHSQPIIQYDFKTGGMTQPGFDIDLISGVVAAVDRKAEVQLYSLHSGHKVKSLPLSRSGSGNEQSANMSNLLFIRPNDHTGPLINTWDDQDQLLATYEKEIIGFSW